MLGAVEYYILHTVKLTSVNVERGEVAMVNKIHLLASIKWNQDHPWKWKWNNLKFITLCSHSPSNELFMPLSRILSPYAFVDKWVMSIQIALPLVRHPILLASVV